MTNDEMRINQFLAERQLSGRIFSKEEKRAGKTPDLRVFSDQEVIFFCEVISIDKDRWLDSQVAAALPGEIVGGGRKDPIFNRLSDDIHTAIKQFDSVNPEGQIPNVLAFVNHDKICGFNDLIGVLTGNFLAEDDHTYPI